VEGRTWISNGKEDVTDRAQRKDETQCRNCWDWQDGKCLFWGVVRSPNKYVCKQFAEFDKIGHAVMKKGDYVEMLNVQKSMSNGCDEDYYAGGSGGGGSDTRCCDVEHKAEYDEILERLESVVDVNMALVAKLRWSVSRVLGEPDRDKALCEDITMSQTLNRLAGQIDLNNQMLDKILEKVKQSVGNLKLFTD
jgi:hypothetical protein